MKAWKKLQLKKGCFTGRLHPKWQQFEKQWFNSYMAVRTIEVAKPFEQRPGCALIKSGVTVQVFFLLQN